MPKPFANSQPITPSLISGDWLLGIQTGNSTGDNGLPQMKYIKLSQLTDWVRSNFGEMWRYRGGFSASLPSDPQDGDYFLATATFSVGADTYTKDHLYAYNGSSWDDISDILTQYASQAQVTDIDDRLTVAEEKIDSMGDGIVYKGEVATYADLAGIVDPQTGWEYYVTADAAFYIYNGASWDQIDNGIVQTITDGDTSHAPSGDAVYDALASEASARESEDSNLKDAIQGNTARIENLEQEHGGYVTVNYRGTNDVPTGKAKYALVERIVGKSRAWNQLNGNENPSSSGAVSGITFTNNQNGSWTISGIATANTAYYISNTIAFQSGHKYLLAGVPSGYGTNICVRVNNDSNSDFGSGVIFEYSSSAQLMIRVKQDTNISSGVTFKPILRDLTLMFPEGVPSTVAECVQKCPDILKYDSYGSSIVDTTVEGVKSVGVNIWDEETELGYWNVGTGASESSTTRLRSKNYIPVLPNSVLYFNCNTRPILFDATKTFMADISPNIGYQDHVAWTVPSGCFFIKLNLATDYGTIYNHDIQISEVHGSVSTVNTTYHPHMESTLTLPTSVTLRSAGSVADTDELNVEVNGVSRRRDTQRISGTPVDLGTLTTWTYSSGDTRFRAVLSSSLGIKIPTSVRTEAVIIPPYKCLSNGEPYGSIGDMCCYLGVEDNEIILFIHDSRYNGSNIVGGKATFLDGVPMIYPLATPVVTLLDPIENNMIQTEGSGTINTVQTQTPVIDNSMDVGYLAL